MRSVLPAALVVAVLALAGCGGGAHRSSQAAAAKKLVDLESTAQLTSLFDRAAGVPRLVLIVSPT